MSSSIINNFTIFLTNLKIAFGEQPLYYDILDNVVFF